MRRPDMLSFESRPRQVVTAGLETLPTIAKINVAGGRVLGMTRVPGRQRRWKLVVNWAKS